MAYMSASTSGRGTNARVFWPATAAVVVIDVATKYLAHTALLPSHLPRDVVGDVVRLTLIYNPGAAVGLNVGPHSRWIFLALTVGALVILGRLYRETKPGESWHALALGLISGGAVGNLINRLWSPRGVVDFIDIGIGTSRWPTFNVADIGVSVGASLLAWVLWRRDRRTQEARR